jgi:hypothetical protein
MSIEQIEFNTMITAYECTNQLCFNCSGTGWVTYLQSNDLKTVTEPCKNCFATGTSRMLVDWLVDEIVISSGL